MSEDERKSLLERWDAIFNKLAVCHDFSHESQEVQAIIKEWYDFLNENFRKNYSLEEFYGLSQVYMEDKRFIPNID